MNHFAIATHMNPPARCQRGLSLVELMVSLTIGLVLLIGVTMLIVQQSSTRAELDKSSRQIENGRYAMQLLHDDIEHAGFFGTYNPSGANYTTPADPCNILPGSASSGWSAPATVPSPIYGYSALPVTTCNLANYKPNTAILVVRRTMTTAVQANAAVPSVTYLQASQCSTDPNPFVFGQGGFTLTQKDCSKPALLYPYVVDVYYVSSCNVCGTDNTPTLKMVQMGLGAAPSAAPTPLVEGIENMQFDYGIDNTGDGTPDIYCTDPDHPTSSTCTATQPAPAPSNWPKVMAIRVNLLARNNDQTTGYSDTKSYCLTGGGPVTNGVPNACAAGSLASNVYIIKPNDQYKRHLYSEVVRLVNPSARLESP